MADTDTRDALVRAIEKTGVRPAEVAVGIGAHPDTLARWISGRTNAPERKVHDAIVWMGEDPADYGMRRRPSSALPAMGLGQQGDPDLHAKLDRLIALAEQNAESNAAILDFLEHGRR